jgi:DNA-binding MarR family transcriptional regulator
MVEILHNGNDGPTTPAGAASSAQAMSIVQSFVHLWAKYESALHKEIAAQRKASNNAVPPKQVDSYIDYGVFYRVSSNLSRKTELTMGELSNALSVPFSTATRLIDTLVADGYIERMQDPDDRRVVRIALTAEGNKLHRTIETFTDEHVQSILSCLSPEEQQSMFKLIRKVTSALEKAT